MKISVARKCSKHRPRCKIFFFPDSFAIFISFAELIFSNDPRINEKSIESTSLSLLHWPRVNKLVMEDTS